MKMLREILDFLRSFLRTELMTLAILTTKYNFIVYNNSVKIYICEYLNIWEYYFVLNSFHY